MNKLALLSLSIILLFSCSQPDEEVPEPPKVIFGWFYGECFGETCVEIYSLDGDLLVEDVNDMYPNESDFYNGDFAIDVSEFADQMGQIVSTFPNDLLLESETVIGTPDAGDWGGIYIEYNDGSAHDFWLIDTKQDNIPDYLHSYVDLVLAKVQVLSN